MATPGIVRIAAPRPFAAPDDATCAALLAAIGANPADLLAATGGGGKTTLLFALARAAARAGMACAVAPTTRMLRPAPGEADRIELVGSAVDCHDALARVRPGERLFLARAEADEGKMLGLDPRWPPAARSPLRLIEADGSACLPLKGHDRHEPVIPAAATLVVPVVGLAALGRPLDERICHRAALAAARLGVPPGTPVTPALCADLVCHPLGYLRGAPPSARVVALLAGAPGREAEADRLAAELLRRGRIEKIILY